MISYDLECKLGNKEIISNDGIEKGKEKCKCTRKLMLPRVL